MPQQLPGLVALIVALSVLSFSAGLYRILRPEGALEERLDHSVKRTRVQPSEPAVRRLFALSSRVNVNQKLAGQLAMELEQADIALTVNEFILIRLGATAGGLVLGTLLLHNVLFGVVSALLALQVPVLILHSRSGRRQSRFQSQLVDVITMLASGLRAGVGLLHAMDLVRREMSAPAGTEFGRVVREVSLGVSLSDALAHLLERMPGDDLAMLVTVINIQAEVGGNLADILDGVVTTIRERIKLAQEVRSLTGQQRLTGYVLGGLPFIVGGAMYLLNPNYMTPLFQMPWLMLPGMAVIMMVIGYAIISKIVDIRV